MSVKSSIEGFIHPLDDNYLHQSLGDEFNESTLNARWALRSLVANSFHFQVDGDSGLRVPVGATDGETLAQTAPSTDEWEAILKFTPNLFHGDPLFGIVAKSTAGSGVVAALRPNSSYIGVATVSSHVYTAIPATGDILSRDSVIHWLRLRQKRATDGMLGSTQAIYIAQYSRDGASWGPPIHYIPSAFTLNELGISLIVNSAGVGWRPVLWRFNVINDLNVGNNLVRNPSSGTATYTADEWYLGPGDTTFSPSKAADGGAGEWVTSNDVDMWWQVAWSVGQTLNRIRVKDVRTNFGHAHAELSDGVTTWVYPFEAFISTGWFVIDLPEPLTGITTLKIVYDKGPTAGFRGLDEVEAYLAS